jgi:hypothetical protein
MTVYRDMFYLGENRIQASGEYGGFKANPLGYWKNDEDAKGHYRIMLDDTFEDTLKELQEADFSILNGITYFGRKNTQEHANKMYAMIFDLDGITDTTLDAFLSGAYRANVYPVPNYIVLSGHGVHLYYLLDGGVYLFPQTKLQLKALKYALTDKMWNQYTSKDKNKQFQGINQGFRVIGGKTKIDGVRVRAFRLNDSHFTLKQLGEYVPVESRVQEDKLYKESKMSLADAKKKFPQWYQDRVIDKKNKKNWICKRDLYDWWKRKIEDGATYGHRYFVIMCLAIYGVKCNISFDEVKQDALALVPFLDALNPEEPFTIKDCLSALECYDKRYCTFPIDDIAKISNIAIEKSKRNGRRRAAHLIMLNEMRRFKRDMLGEDEYKNNGRPSKEQLIMEYLQANQGESVTEISRQLGVSRTTVYKYKKLIQP